MRQVKNNGLALEFVSESLRSDKSIVSIAVRENFRTLQYASEELQNDKYVVQYISSTVLFIYRELG